MQKSSITEQVNYLKNILVDEFHKQKKSLKLNHYDEIIENCYLGDA